MNTDKKGVRLIAEICKSKGIRKVVFSPGSRSAPLVIAFSNIPEVECIVIPDERVAGYFALGMAQQLSEPVAVVCTSGTAVLNLAPAVCEAYYQQIPLVVITADRPRDLIGVGENQAINQTQIFANFIKLSCDVAEETNPLLLSEIIYTALNEATDPQPGPVHLNLHLREPLYNQSDEGVSLEAYQPTHRKAVRVLPHGALQKALEQNKCLIVCGLQNHDHDLNSVLNTISKHNNVSVITETTSNFNFNDAITNADLCCDVMSDAGEYQPELLITLGRQIVSKKLKQFLKKHPPLHHIQIAAQSESWNFTGAKDFDHLKVDAASVLRPIAETFQQTESNYKELWQVLSAKAKQKAEEYLSTIPFSDLKAFEIITGSLPAAANIQYGNSTPIRYSNFFKHHNSLTFNSNRGTSGIDGCVSTASGAAYANNNNTVCIVGDVSFLYDSNALWNNYLSSKLRIIIINNSGGNIFRLIDGPPSVKGFEKFFETQHQHTAKHLATMYDIPYYFCDDENGLKETLNTFYGPQNNKPAILEIKTDGVTSANVYKDFFKYLRANQ